MEYKLTPEKLAELKDNYPGISLFKVKPVPTKIEFVIRPLYPQDHEALVDIVRTTGADVDANEIYESYIFDNCILWPVLTEEEQQMLPLGVKPEIQNAVTYQSGYVSVTPNHEVIAEPKNVVPVAHPSTWDPPTGIDIQELKEQWPFCALYKVRVGPYHFIIRPLLNSDLDKSFNLHDNIAVVDKATIWPEEFNLALIPFGTVISLASTIKNMSGESYDLDIIEL